MSGLRIRASAPRTPISLKSRSWKLRRDAGMSRLRDSGEGIWGRCSRAWTWRERSSRLGREKGSGIRTREVVDPCGDVVKRKCDQERVSVTYGLQCDRETEECERRRILVTWCLQGYEVRVVRTFSVVKKHVLAIFELRIIIHF